MKQIIFGNFIFTKTPSEFEILEQTYMLIDDGIIEDTFREIPEEYKNIKVTYYKDEIIIPGLVDLHVHAPQYQYRGLGLDKELLDWLNDYTYKEENKYKDLAYAEKAYGIFVDDLRKSATTHAVLFATVYKDSTLLLMDKLEKSGLVTYVGKLNMDRNCPSFICEQTDDSLKETEEWILESQKRGYKNTKPIITPRFVPTCSDSLLNGLGEIQEKYNLTFQSHLDENPSEIEWVKELCPTKKNYTDVYHSFGLLSRRHKALLAHCVYLDEDEIKMIKENEGYIVHCPESNMNVTSGIAPIRRYMDEGMHVGLGSDIAGGSEINMFKAISHAVQSSKLRYRHVDSSLKALSESDGFYLATKGGGSFFGKVGSFEKGYEFNAVILNDERLRNAYPLSLKERMQRIIYLGDEREVRVKYIKGKII